MRWVVLVALVGCGGGSDAPAPAPAPKAAPAVDARVADAAPVVEGDPAMADLLGKKADAKAIGDYAFQHQNDTRVAQACAAVLRDPDRKLLGAACLEHVTALAATSVLPQALDAIDAEPDDAVRAKLAWGIKDAEAVTAKLDDRVLAMIAKYPGDTGAHLFDTLFPRYLMQNGPVAPPKAQALALAALADERSPLHFRALDIAKTLSDTPAVCATLGGLLRPDAKRWDEAIEALARIGEPCAAEVPKAVALVVASKQVEVRSVVALDRAFALDAATRGKLLAAVRAWKKPASPYQQGQLASAEERLTKERKK